MPFSALLEKDFIGRNHELESLYNIHSEVKRGIATSIFLSGQRGIGKTELLKQLFQLLYWKQHEAVPFFYTVNPAFASVYDFSMDYLNKFIRQWLSFQKKDVSLIHANGLSTENLMHLAEKSDAHWAVDIIGNFLQVKTSADAAKLFFSAINTPYHSYLTTGMPVIVIIDNFQKTKEFYGPHSENNNNLWMLFEEVIKYRQAPHILTGSQTELQGMFFEKTSLGESLEFINLSGIDKSTSLKLFTSFCNSYGIAVDRESLSPFADLFNGNPFYIKNFIQTLRKEGKNLSADDLWNVYFNEITIGKFYTCWISQLRKHIPRLELRKVSLEILYHLCSRRTSTAPSNLANMFLISINDLNDIVNIFQTAGIIEMNFSSLKLTEDTILTNVIKGLYNKEILGNPADKIKEVLLKERHIAADTYVKTVEPPLFEITIPNIPRAELIALTSLEQIAKSQNISPETIGQLQVALVDLFTNIMPQEKSSDDGNFYLKFKPDKDKFTIEIKTPYKELASLSSPDAIPENQLIKRYIDDIKLEETKSGIKIILTKELKKDTVPST